jgi:hypothetical protein
LVASTVTRLKDEVLNNVRRTSKKQLTAEERTSKLQRLEAHMKQMPAGISRQRLNSFLTQLSGQSSVIGAVETEGTQTRNHTTQQLQPLAESLNRIEQSIARGSPKALIDCATPLQDMHAFVRQTVMDAAPLVEACKLTRGALTRFAHALQSLANEPPGVCAYPDLRSLNPFDISGLAEVLNLRKWHGKGKIGWQNVQQVKDDIINASGSPDGECVRKAFEARVYLRNLSFISKQSDVLAPGSLVQCRIKKAVHVAIVAEPTVWTEAESLVLAYRVMDLDNDAQNCSIAASAVVKVLHATSVSVNLELPTPVPDSVNFVLDQLSRLPWPSEKLGKLAELAGLQLQPEANGIPELVVWANSFLAMPKFVCFEPLLLPCAETAPSADGDALPVHAV